MGGGGGSFLERITPEQSLGYDLELQRRGKERRKGVGEAHVPFHDTEMRNGVLQF